MHFITAESVVRKMAIISSQPNAPKIFVCAPSKFFSKIFRKKFGKMKKTF